MNDTVKEVQDYLEQKGIIVAETTIVNAAIDLVRRLGAGDYTFFCELKNVKENRIEIEQKEKKI